MAAKDAKRNATTQDAAQSSTSSSSSITSNERDHDHTSKQHSNGFYKPPQNEIATVVNERTKLLKNTTSTYNATDVVSEPTEDEEQARQANQDEEPGSKENESIPPGTMATISLLLLGVFSLGLMLPTSAHILCYLPWIFPFPFPSFKKPNPNNHNRYIRSQCRQHHGGRYLRHHCFLFPCLYWGCMDQHGFHCHVD